MVLQEVWVLNVLAHFMGSDMGLETRAQSRGELIATLDTQAHFSPKFKQMRTRETERCVSNED